MKLTARATRFVLATAAVVLAQLVQAAPIVVGQVAPMSGIEANQGRAYAVGMKLFFDNVNKAGGVNGHTFVLVRKDDGGRPEVTVTATEQLLAEARPIVLAGYFGIQNVSAVVNSGMLERARIALVGYRAAEIRSGTPYLYSVRADLRDEVNKVIEHLATIGINRLGLFYEEGAGAGALVAAAQEASNKVHAVIVAQGSYSPGTARVSQAVAAFAKASPQAILMVTNGAAAAAFIEQYRASGGVAQLFANSGADIEQLSKRLAEEQMQGVAIAQVMPNPYRISSKVAKELNDAVAKTEKLDALLSYAMMEGFITAKVIVEAVRRQGARPTREGMAAALDSIENFDAGGYVVGFKPGMHTGSKFVELSIISGAGKIRQ